MDALFSRPAHAASRPSGTQAVARAAALLRAIAASPRREIGLADLARALELERPTAHRILQRLVEEGLVRQNPATRGYQLGPLVYELGLAAQPPLTLYSVSSDALTAVAQGSGDTAFAIITSGLDGVCLDRREGSYPVKALMLEVGRRRPMGSGAGSIAMLATLPPEAAERILDTNAARLRAAGEPDTQALKRMVRQARQTGYAVNAPGEAPEIMSIGVAVQNAYGTPIMGLSICALRFRIEKRLDALARLLRAGKSEIEARLQPAPAA
ncbi:IclR family transcriptional regulator [Ramlibacter sp.]|uniref:IclR family transcriptional regulator n=1 Tax=Ramlibacter sp. TaxID=1917967 RepID=UPI0035B0DD6A